MKTKKVKIMENKLSVSQNILSDYALVKKIKKGDEKSFNELFKKYKDKLNFFILNLTKGNTELSKDICMEVLQKVFVKLNQNKFDMEKGAFSTWMYNMARNHYIDYLRCNKTKVLSFEDIGVENEESDNFAFQIKSHHHGPEEILIKEQTKNAVQKAIAESDLKDSMREMIKLRFMEEFSYEEIAEKMKLPLGTIKAKLFRAKAILKVYMRGNKLFS
jgi:RNA polymerase sigma-70 factor (ECF subfamily)